MFKIKNITDEFDREDINKNFAYGILSYLGILVFISLFCRDKNSKYTTYCVNQGLKLFIINAIYGFAAAIVMIIINVLIAIFNIFVQSFILIFVLNMINIILSLVISLLSTVVLAYIIIAFVYIIQKKVVKIEILDKLPNLVK